ncbi:MAG: ribbon-helix-helix domain-containing protein [Alphaproteobacteria bacterium]|nr:ribbon-helix-helix domain-containing protein [Alphaproteobacteria bacterium]
MRKRSVNILGHQTSITLEEEFWTALKDIAKQQEKSINKLIAEIDKTRNNKNLSSALRVFILKTLTE